MNENERKPRTRNLLLIDLADSIRQLTEPRTHTEMLEAVQVDVITTRSGKTRERRTMRRRGHVVTLPPLLEALHTAAVPGAGEAGEASAAGGFESRPSAELEPLAVLHEIIDQAGFWSRVFSIERPTLARTISALVGAPHDDAQLERITMQAARWVKRARLATGFDPAPFTLGSPCPYCARRNALTITGDMQTARCNRCGVDWTPDTIGLLADMLINSAHHETLALAPCWMPDCTVYGDHDLHRNARGQTWHDTCAV